MPVEFETYEDAAEVESDNQNTDKTVNIEEKDVQQDEKNVEIQFNDYFDDSESDIKEEELVRRFISGSYTFICELVIGKEFLN